MIRILKNKVQLWEQGSDWKAHVARCARVCYASSKQDGNEQMVQRLYDQDHLSMFRHRSMYWALPVDSVKWSALYAMAKNNPYMRVKREGQDGLGDIIFISTNGHFWLDHGQELELMGITEENQCSPEVMASGPGKEIMRYTFWLRTQVSTSRELNRVSPNNIAEQSTRFCNYTKDGFNGAPAICTPWWFDLHEPNGLGEDDEILFCNEGCHEEFVIGNGPSLFWDDMKKAYAYRFMDEQGPKVAEMILRCYLNSLAFGGSAYQALVGQYHMKPQDARGVLNLDLCTEVVYTYFYDEWERLFENRCEGKRGVPHPNARMVMEKVQGILDNIYDNERC